MPIFLPLVQLVLGGHWVTLEPHKSRSEQAPKNVFLPFLWCDKFVCGSLGLPWRILKADPESYGSYGSYELIMSNESD